uniref:Glycine receptor subunit alphaZ1 n=1 Tax=Schistocephalus solidus TaxID=70667 RepID=A0A183T362_SCHSO
LIALQSLTTANLKQKIPTTPRKLLLQKLLSDYNTEELPTEILELPTVVEVNMKVLALYSVDVRNMHYYIDALLRQNWVDPRLAWNTTEELKNYTRPLMASRLKAVLWLPDLFFRNGRDGYLHKMTFPNYLLRVYPDGSVTYSQKITMRFACQMDLRTFPMDVQRCDINIGSYAYTLSDLKFVWREVMPVELPKKLQVSDYLALTTVKTLDCALLVKTSTVSYTCLRAIFTFNRQLGYYLVTFYIPSILIIVISFLSFWVNTDAATARVSLGLLSLLCLLTQASYTMTSLPRVSYTTAIDIWFMFSIIFVTCVLVEYAFAIAMLQRNEVVSGRMNVRQIVSEELVHRSVTSQQPSVGGSDESRKHSALCTEQENTMKAAATKTTKAGIAPPESEIDRCSRFIFPLCYIIYNIFYWLYYLVIVKQTENPD